MDEPISDDLLKPAPRAVFDGLEKRRDRPRFMVPQTGGDWQPVSWGHYADAIQAFAGFLLDLGITPGDVCAIYGSNRISWAEAALGVQAANGVLVPVYPLSMPEQVHYVLGHSDAKVLIIDQPERLQALLALPQKLQQLEWVVLLEPLTVEQREQLQASCPVALLEWSQALLIGQKYLVDHGAMFWQRLEDISLDDIGLMLYTSGTTGRPKGVPLSHGNVAINGRDWLECVNPVIADKPVDLLWLPFSHIFGFGELCLGNSLGFTSYCSTPAAILEHLPQVSPNILMSVPSYWEKLALSAMEESNPQQALLRLTGGELRFCLSGGAGLKRQVKELFLQAGMLIIEGYGLTEASPTLTLNRPGSFDFETVGKPLRTVELKLAEDGEILARGPSIFAGYHKDAAATAAVFDAEGWFYTGDVGEFTAEGFVKIIDRKKDILVTANGKNVPPANIELQFMDDALIDHLVLYGNDRKYLVAGVWLNVRERQRLQTLCPTGVASADYLRQQVAERIEQVNQHLARHQRIQRFGIFDEPLTVESGLLTPSLKLKRRQVYQHFRCQFEALYQNV